MIVWLTAWSVPDDFMDPTQSKLQNRQPSKLQTGRFGFDQKCFHCLGS